MKDKKDKKLTYEHCSKIWSAIYNELSDWDELGVHPGTLSDEIIKIIEPIIFDIVDELKKNK